MADRPILFSAPMVRALLAGTKVQTRRILKWGSEPPVWDGEGLPTNDPAKWGFRYYDKGSDSDDIRYLPDVPRIRISDRLWVREAWSAPESLDMYAPTEIGAMDASCTGSPLWFPISYIADETIGGSTWASGPAFGRKRASMHLPRWASRITLTVTDVRVQRLQDISEADALAEGIIYENVITDIVCYGGPTIERTADRYFGPHILGDHDGFESAAEAYFNLWDGINGEGSADENPWISATTFTVHHANIDALPAPDGEGR